MGLVSIARINSLPPPIPRRAAVVREQTWALNGKVSPAQHMQIDVGNSLCYTGGSVVIKCSYIESTNLRLRIKDGIPGLHNWGTWWWMVVYVIVELSEGKKMLVEIGLSWQARTNTCNGLSHPCTEDLCVQKNIIRIECHMLSQYWGLLVDDHWHDLGEQIGYT